MAVQPSPASVLALAPVITDTELTAVVRELETERSAGRAILAALREMESTVTAERQRNAIIEADLGQTRETLATREADLEHGRRATLALFSQLEEARAALQEERTRPFFQRLLNR